MYDEEAQIELTFRNSNPREGPPGKPGAQALTHPGSELNTLTQGRNQKFRSVGQ